MILSVDSLSVHAVSTMLVKHKQVHCISYNHTDEDDDDDGDDEENKKEEKKRWRKKKKKGNKKETICK